MNHPPYILTISGSDSSGCAGMQADNRAILASGGFPINVLTAVTLQTPSGVERVEPASAEFVAKQLRRLLQTFPVAAIKSGMLATGLIAGAVAEVLEDFPSIPYVLDPVLVSTSGSQLLEEEGVAVVRARLMPRATVTTPNSDELWVLSAEDVRKGRIESCRILAKGIGQAVLLKGGHEDGQISEDWLLMPDGTETNFASPRIETENLRGTGCVLSSAIAGFLGRGDSLIQSVHSAKELLTDG